MSRFYGDLQGSRGQAARCGTPNSGISSHVRGWDIGIRVDVTADGPTDKVNVSLTGGSNYPSSVSLFTVSDSNRDLDGTPNTFKLSDRFIAMLEASGYTVLCEPDPLKED